MMDLISAGSDDPERLVSRPPQFCESVVEATKWELPKHPI